MAGMGARLMDQVRRIERMPFGKTALRLGLQWKVPYAASVRPEVELVAPGHARARMRDRRAVRNHLDSIHAGALFTLAETAANFALMSRTPEQGRWIVTSMAIEYKKKARGPLVAEAQLSELDWSKAQDVEGEARIFDTTGDVVAIARPRWRIGPHERRAKPATSPGA